MAAWPGVEHTAVSVPNVSWVERHGDFLVAFGDYTFGVLHQPSMTSRLFDNLDVIDKVFVSCVHGDQIFVGRGPRSGGAANRRLVDPATGVVTPVGVAGEPRAAVSIGDVIWTINVRFLSA